MAVIKKFDVSEVDYDSVIARKYYNGEYEDCIKTIRFLLGGADVEIDVVVTCIFLIKSYYNLGLYEEAFFEIKSLLTLGVNNLELSVLAMECIDKLGRLNAHKYFNFTNFDFINDNFDEDGEQDVDAETLNIANASADDILYRKQLISSKIIVKLEGYNEARSENGFLSLVSKEESYVRLYKNFMEFINEKKYEDAILLMTKALKKDPAEIMYMEHLLLAYDRAKQNENYLEMARQLMHLSPESTLGVNSYVFAHYKSGDKPDWDVVYNFALCFKTNDVFKLWMMAQTLLVYRENIEMAQFVLDNNAHLSAHCYYVFIRAYIAMRCKGKDAAIEIFKHMRAIFGDRCFADECIELVKSGKLSMADACGIPRDAVIKSMVKIDLILRDKNIKFSEYLVDNPSLFDDIKHILYSDEEEFARKILKKLDKKAVVSVLWDLQQLLLEDIRVKESIRQMILYTVLSKLPYTRILVSEIDVVEDIDAEEFMKIADGDRKVENALIIAMSKLFFKEATMSIRFKSAVKHVKEFKDKTRYDNPKYLAELMLVDCWYYGVEFTAETIAEECKLKISTLADYLQSYNKFSRKSKFPSVEDDMGDIISVEGDLDEIMGDFASFIDKITGEIQDKPTLRLIKHNNVVIDDEENDDSAEDDPNGDDSHDDNGGDDGQDK